MGVEDWLSGVADRLKENDMKKSERISNEIL